MLAAAMGLSAAEKSEGKVAARMEAATRRDPFWPVGYAPPAPARAAAGFETETADVVWPALPVRGHSRAADGTYRILVEGVGVVGEKKVVSIQSNGRWFHWRILRITERGVESARLGITRTRFPAKPVPKTPADPEPRLKEKAP
ncbi:MAG TPA: hypothetical protein DCM68_01760 [Verrucomicrobia bacterium]|nr:hypothetical protein [Verrucomicrobiota bacterium]